MRFIYAASLGFVLAVSGQQAPEAPQAGVTFKTTTQLVVVNVSAKDKNNDPIPGLTASDFTVTEDGKPQRISVFEYQQLEEPGAPAAQPEPAARTASAQAPPPAERTPAAARASGPVKYKDRRLLVLFFDLAGMPVQDQIRAQQGALKFIKGQLAPSDLVSVMTYSTTLDVVQDFTDDRDRLLSAVTDLPIGDTGASSASTEEDTGAAFSDDDTEFSIFNTDRKLAALGSAAAMLRGMPEKKALVYFTSGMSRTGIDNQAQLRATINAAVRANVSLYPVDARGLVATAPLGDATTGSPGGRGMYSGESQRSAQSGFQDQQETLYTLAADSGGKALLDRNDLSLGIVQAQRDISSYYILGYYSTNPALDGTYRRIKVQINGRSSAKLDYRGGYFAPKDFRRFNASDRERQLQEALMLGDPVTDLPMALEVNYFRQARDRYFVPVSIKIPGSDLELARKGGADTARLDFIGQVRDAKGLMQAAVRDAITVKLKGGEGSRLAERNLGYDTAFTLEPGSYTLRFLVRENETGKMGTFETKFDIPDLTSERKRLPISSVVLSHQREELSSAVGSAERNRKLILASPLVQGNEKLVPSVTRVFRQDQEMYVFLQAYQPAATATEPLLAAVGFYRGKVKAFETAPLRITEGLDAKSKAVPVRFSVPLTKLQPGRYTCQVTVVQPERQLFAAWRANIVVLP